MQTIGGLSISNSHAVYFPDLYSPFPGIQLGQMLKCECQTFEVCMLNTQTLYLQVMSENGAPQISVPRPSLPALNFAPVVQDGDLYNFAIPLGSFDGQIVLELSQGGTTLTSSPIRVKDSFDPACHTLFEWRSECLAQGIDYTLDPNFIQQIYVPTRYLRPTAPGTSTYNATKDSAGFYDFCSSDFDEVWTVALDEIPDWLVVVLEKAVLNSTFRLNGADFFSRSGIQLGERRCCHHQGLMRMIPRDNPFTVVECCINDFTGFVQKPQAQINCNSAGMNPVIDTRGSSDADNNIIDASSTGITYIYQFGVNYYATIDATSDPTLAGSWTYLSGANTSADFFAELVPYITLPAGGFAGYFELDCAALDFLGLEFMSIVVTIQDSDAGSVSNGVICVIACDTADPECPVPDLSQSTQADINMINITNLGSVDLDGNPIHNSPDYNFVHTFTDGPCGSPPSVPIFTVSGVGGSAALTFSGWHPTIAGNLVLQGNVMALFSGGMDAAGYTFDKEAVVFELLSGGLNVGGEWCLSSTVTHIPTNCSDSTELTIISDLLLVEFAGTWVGWTPSLQTSSRTGLARYDNQNGAFGFGTVGSEISANRYYLEGNVALAQAQGAAVALDSLAGIQSQINNFIDNDRVYHGLYNIDNTGLQSYADTYLDWDGVGINSFVRIRWAAAVNFGITGGFGGGVLVRMLWESGGTGVLAGETLASTIQEVQRFPLGGGGITLTAGGNDPSDATPPLHEANIQPGGTPHAFTVGGSPTQVVINSLVEGTYYVKFKTTSSSGYENTAIASFTVFEV